MIVTEDVFKHKTEEKEGRSVTLAETAKADSLAVGIAYLEHYGVPGMKWGRRMARNRELNKASRKKDKAELDKKIDDARAKIKSGEHKREGKIAKAQYKIDKQNIGSREARKILNAKREKLAEEKELAASAKSGKETATRLMVAVGQEILVNKARDNAKSRAAGPRPEPTRRGGVVIDVQSRVKS